MMQEPLAVQDETKPNLLTDRESIRPFYYPGCIEAWRKQGQVHWLPEEVPMADDVKDWNHGLTEEEKHLLTQILRFFTQADVEVSNCYIKHYMRIFKAPEVLMMMSAFSYMETVHIMAYAHLLDTIGMPEVEFQAFLKYEQMKNKYDYMRSFNPKSKKDVAKTMAVFGAFIEGLQLFASFAMLFNFQRFGKMKGMCQIVAWSVRDETLHTNSIIDLFHIFVHENPEIWDEELRDYIYENCRSIVEHEDAFIDLAFEMSEAIQGLSAQEVKDYIRYIANRRLKQLGLNEIYDVDSNPLPWMDEILGAPEHTNFFENRVTEYARASTKGDWSEVFEDEESWK